MHLKYVAVKIASRDGLPVRVAFKYVSASNASTVSCKRNATKDVSVENAFKDVTVRNASKDCTRKKCLLGMRLRVCLK
jgi:hypothetical protein